MPDLKVGYQLLGDSEDSLKFIQREFQKCAKRQDDLAEDVGAQAIRDAMHEFADNWSDNRKQTLQNIEDVLKLVSAAKQGFEKLEEKLAKATKEKD